MFLIVGSLSSLNAESQTVQLDALFYAPDVALFDEFQKDILDLNREHDNVVLAYENKINELEKINSDLQKQVVSDRKRQDFCIVIGVCSSLLCLIGGFFIGQAIN